MAKILCHCFTGRYNVNGVYNVSCTSLGVRLEGEAGGNNFVYISFFSQKPGSSVFKSNKITMMWICGPCRFKSLCKCFYIKNDNLVLSRNSQKLLRPGGKGKRGGGGGGGGGVLYKCRRRKDLMMTLNLYLKSLTFLLQFC